MVISNIEASESFYSKVLGREPNDRPMNALVQWRGYSNAGIQLFKDAAKVGNITMTIVVSDIEQTKLFLKDRFPVLGQTQQEEYGKIFQLSDPDGNNLTFAEPPKDSDK